MWPATVFKLECSPNSCTSISQEPREFALMVSAGNFKCYSSTTCHGLIFRTSAIVLWPVNGKKEFLAPIEAANIAYLIGMLRPPWPWVVDVRDF